MKTVLSIAGSDPSGGAGIQADLKTIAAHGMYGMTVLTALTAQNTLGVYEVQAVSEAFAGRQMDCIFQDIRPDAVKIGMLPNGKVLSKIAEKLEEYQAENLVIDPVLAATAGTALAREETIKAMKEQLFPLGSVITPNLPEAEIFSGVSIHTREDRVRAAQKLAAYTRGGILLKGGHLTGPAEDLLYFQGECFWLQEARIENPNNHGTGCTLSSAIACSLAEGYSLQKSVERAKKYITGALAAMLDLGKGNGPLNHMWNYSKPI